MRKLRSDARWHKLTPEQQQQIQHWLLVEQLGYTQTHRLMQEQLGVRCALSTIGPLYHYLRELRSREHDTMLEKLTEVITEPGADLARVRADSLAVITKRLLERARVRDNTKEIVALGRLMLRGEGREIERARLDLARRSAASRQGRADVPTAARATGEHYPTRCDANRDKPG